MNERRKARGKMSLPRCAARVRAMRRAVEPVLASRPPAARPRRSRSAERRSRRRILFEPSGEKAKDPQREKADQRVPMKRTRRLQMNEINRRRGRVREQTRLGWIHEPVPFGADDELGHREASDRLRRPRLAAEHSSRRETRRADGVAQADLTKGPGLPRPRAQSWRCARAMRLRRRLRSRSKARGRRRGSSRARSWRRAATTSSAMIRPSGTPTCAASAR